MGEVLGQDAFDYLHGHRPLPDFERKRYVNHRPYSVGGGTAHDARVGADDGER